MNNLCKFLVVSLLMLLSTSALAKTVVFTIDNQSSLLFQYQVSDRTGSCLVSGDQKTITCQTGANGIVDSTVVSTVIDPNNDPGPRLDVNYPHSRSNFFVSYPNNGSADGPSACAFLSQQTWQGDNQNVTMTIILNTHGPCPTNLN